MIYLLRLEYDSMKGLLRVTTSSIFKPIVMSNYQGYIVEESIFQPKKKNRYYCEIFTKTYRRKGDLEWLWWDDLWGRVGMI